MRPPVQLQRIPRKRRPFKPATVRALFWVVVISCLLVFASGLFSKFA